MLYSKPATTIDRQIQLLQGRGLVCADLEMVKRYLGAIGYYRLSAYWLPFEEVAADGQTRSKKFKDGTTFEDVLAIYIFDRKLRLHVMEAIERIEINVRARWTNRLTLAHGPHVHLDPSQFVNGWDHAALLARMAKTVGESKETFNEHYRKKYRTPYMPPLWAVSETMTLGELSQWVTGTADLKVRGAIAKDLGIPSREVLEGVLQVLSLVRNICAHHGRLWNRRLVKRIPNIKRMKADIVLEIQDNGDQTQHQPENLIYNVLIVILHMLNAQNTDTHYPARLKELIETVTDKQRAAMGFPEDWRQRPAWGAK